MPMVMIRSWLFVPGHRQKMIDKSPGRGSDALIYDLEDAVPPDERNAARAKVGAALDAANGGPRRFVRIHGAGHGAHEADLRAVVRPGLEGLVLPKVDRPEDVLTCRSACWPNGSPKPAFRPEAFGWRR